MAPALREQDSTESAEPFKLSELRVRIAWHSLASSCFIQVTGWGCGLGGVVLLLSCSFWILLESFQGLPGITWGLPGVPEKFRNAQEKNILCILLFIG